VLVHPIQFYTLRFLNVDTFVCVVFHLELQICKIYGEEVRHNAYVYATILLLAEEKLNLIWLELHRLGFSWIVLFLNTVFGINGSHHLQKNRLTYFRNEFISCQISHLTSETYIITWKMMWFFWESFLFSSALKLFFFIQITGLVALLVLHFLSFNLLHAS
jgi:hypothetical protein